MRRFSLSIPEARNPPCFRSQRYGTGRCLLSGSLTSSVRGEVRLSVEADRKGQLPQSDAFQSPPSLPFFFFFSVPLTSPDHCEPPSARARTSSLDDSRWDVPTARSIDAFLPCLATLPSPQTRLSPSRRPPSPVPVSRRQKGSRAAGFSLGFPPASRPPSVPFSQPCSIGRNGRAPSSSACRSKKAGALDSPLKDAQRGRSSKPFLPASATPSSSSPPRSPSPL